jgi:CII-binding regulator of phage lambda lysogenization HflD
MYTEIMQGRVGAVGITRIAGAVIVIVLLVVVAVKHEAISEWLRLRTYQPPKAIAALAIDDTMTDQGRRFFYLNRPELLSNQKFTKKCPAGTEETVVLGCYHSGQHGIFLLKVTDKRLQGVEQVTAAHEMLHAVYDQLNRADKQAVNGMLKDFYHHGLHNKTIKKILKNYKKTEPGQSLNEMHSIFGTEISKLPHGLRHYYQRYFKNRSKVVKYYKNYRSAFSSRQQTIKQYDATLKTWAKQIDSDKSNLDVLNQRLKSLKAQLHTYKTNQEFHKYNALVPVYNNVVDTYNNNIKEIKSLIKKYNTLVNKRNKIAFQEKQLLQAVGGGKHHQKTPKSTKSPQGKNGNSTQ